MTISTRRTLYRMRNRINSPDGYSAAVALVVLLGIAAFFVRHA